MDTSFVKTLSYEDLQQLLPVVSNELHAKNPATIAENKRQEAFWAEYQRKVDAKESARSLAYQSLKRVLAPGMLLKMKGCKDGQGLREFIRWDDESLVCWQIRRRRVISGARTAITVEENTNVVTTHMADKVSGVFGKTSKLLVPMKNILAGLNVS